MKCSVQRVNDLTLKLCFLSRNLSTLYHTCTYYIVIQVSWFFLPNLLSALYTCCYYLFYYVIVFCRFYPFQYSFICVYVSCTFLKIHISLLPVFLVHHGKICVIEV